MKNLIKIALIALASLGLTAAPAFGQTTGTGTYTPTTTTTTCQTGCPTTNPTQPVVQTTMPYQTVNTVIGSAAFNGVVMGAFGTYGPNGTIVAGTGITGKVDLTKSGSGDVKVDYTAASNFCQADCTTQRFGVNAWAREQGSSVVTATSTVPAQSVVIANSGTLNAGVQLRYGSIQVPVATTTAGN